MRIMFPSFTRTHSKAPPPKRKKSRKVFRLFKRLDDGRFMIAGWSHKYPKYRGR